MIYTIFFKYYIYIYISIISEIPIKGWLLSFVLLSWHASLILYSWHHRQWHARKMNKREPNDGWDRLVPTCLAFTAPFAAPSSSMSFKAFWTCSCTEIWCFWSMWIWCGCDGEAKGLVLTSSKVTLGWHLIPKQNATCAYQAPRPKC